MWAVLSVDDEEQPCGWVKGRFGVSWQIVPDFVWDVDTGNDREKAQKMNIALFDMRKIDIAKLKESMR